MVSEELKAVARAIAEWAAPVPRLRFHLYGSRVRGDHRVDSDVDIHVAWPRLPEREEVVWWTEENERDFAGLRKVLPGRLEFLEPRDPLGEEIEKGEVVYVDRNVVCIRRAGKVIPSLDAEGVKWGL
jgi:predicted nucleotidyltransferase